MFFYYKLLHLFDNVILHIYNIDVRFKKRRFCVKKSVRMI